MLFAAHGHYCICSDKGTFARRLRRHDGIELTVGSSLTEEGTFLRTPLKHYERAYGRCLQLMDTILSVRPRTRVRDALEDMMAWDWMLPHLLPKMQIFQGRL